jgi:hypothetical protein
MRVLNHIKTLSESEQSAASARTDSSASLRFDSYQHR